MLGQFCLELQGKLDKDVETNLDQTRDMRGFLPKNQNQQRCERRMHYFWCCSHPIYSSTKQISVLFPNMQYLLDLKNNRTKEMYVHILLEAALFSNYFRDY